MEQVIANGLYLGAQYALIALGLTLIFSLMNVLNFAHGQMYVLGGFVTYTVVAQFELPFIVGLLASGLVLGAVGALVIALANRRLSLPLMRQAMDGTVRLSCFVMFILIGSTVFSLAFQAVDGPKWVEHLLVSLPGGALGFLIVVNLLIFALAFFLDFFELAFIVVPLLAPVAALLGIDLVWFGVLLAVNMQTSFMHPPFGFALFYLRSVAPDTEYTDAVTGRRTAPVTIGQIYRGAIPFVLIQLAMVALIIAFPGVVSRNHDTAAETDANSTLQQMQADTDAADAALSSASEPDAGEDDPMKAMQRAIEADRLVNPK